MLQNMCFKKHGSTDVPNCHNNYADVLDTSPHPTHAHAQGVIYSPTAAANYKSDDVFDMYVENIPARRVGYPEEVSCYSCSYKHCIRDMSTCACLAVTLLTGALMCSCY